MDRRRKKLIEEFLAMLDYWFEKAKRGNNHKSEKEQLEEADRDMNYEESPDQEEE
ncbi:hypothetical protein ES703_14029 [subsurface metagenome]